MMGNIELYNGQNIPDIAFGTGVMLKYSRKPALCAKMLLKQGLSSIKHGKVNRELKGSIRGRKILEQAYESGFRFFDTARIYGYSEPRIGKLHKNDLTVVTKVSDLDLERGLSTVKENLEQSLMYLNREYVDLYLLHYPHGDWIKMYQEMELLLAEGKTSAIGLCNCNVEHLEILRREGRVRPMAIQIELHPLNSKQKLRTYCQEHGICVMAHTPTGRMCSEIMEQIDLRRIAENHKKTVPQVILRWHLQNRVIPVVSTFEQSHMLENRDIYDFELSEEEIETINQLDRGMVILQSTQIDDPKYRYNL